MLINGRKAESLFEQAISSWEETEDRNKFGLYSLFSNIKITTSRSHYFHNLFKERQKPKIFQELIIIKY